MLQHISIQFSTNKSLFNFMRPKSTLEHLIFWPIKTLESDVSHPLTPVTYSHIKELLYPWFIYSKYILAYIRKQWPAADAVLIWTPSNVGRNPKKLTLTYLRQAQRGKLNAQSAYRQLEHSKWSLLHTIILYSIWLMPQFNQFRPCKNYFHWGEWSLVSH